MAKKGSGGANKTSKPMIQDFSWRNFFIATSVTLNIAFIIVFATMMWTNRLDGMFIREGLARYCDEVNDSKFASNSDKAHALRMFTCARDDAKEPFDKAVNDYLQMKQVQNGY